MSEEAGVENAKAADGNTLLVPIRSDLPWRSVGGWLRRGWQDFRKCWPLSAWFGLCFVCMGWLQLLIFQLFGRRFIVLRKTEYETTATAATELQVIGIAVNTLFP